ncbi:MAG: ribonuclease P [Methanoregula sp.]|jgi:ribonuclease P/MRP protein subunit RPP1|nr:ribonuclease P [Methanoregula sp.]
MKITDAAVFPYPKGDTSVRRFALEAGALGFDSLVAIDTPSATYGDVEVRSGIIFHDIPVRDIVNHMKRYRGTDAVISVKAGDAGFNRAVIGVKGIHVLRSIHMADKKGFDHVSAKMAADNNVAVDIDLSVLTLARGIARQRAIARYRDVLVLEQRFEFPLTLSTYARSVLDLRAVREFTGLCSLLDMDISSVEKSLAGVGAVLTPPAPAVRVIT